MRHYRCTSVIGPRQWYVTDQQAPTPEQAEQQHRKQHKGRYVDHGGIVEVVELDRPEDTIEGVPA